MDVRRQARLTAAIVPSGGTAVATVPSLVAHPAQSLGVGPVPAYVQAYALGHPPQGSHVSHLSHAKETALTAYGAAYGVQVPPRTEARPGGSQGPRKSDNRVGHLGVSDGLVKKDRRKDRHKRASDGRNPMIRLNPSTADRFFAVQRLLESKRLKKTSGSFVINWLIDVAHASIQAVLEQGVSGDQQASAAGAAAAAGEVLGDQPESQQQQQQQQQHSLKPEDASGRSTDGVLSLPSQARRGQQQEQYSNHVADATKDNAAMNNRPATGANGHLGDVNPTGDDEDEELLVTDPAPHDVMQAHGEVDLSRYLQQGQSFGQPSRPTAAEIARTAMASAEAAEAQTLEADDEDEEVDVVADEEDGPFGASGAAALQAAFQFGQPGLGQPGLGQQNQADNMWMRGAQVMQQSNRQQGEAKGLDIEGP